MAFRRGINQKVNGDALCDGVSRDGVERDWLTYGKRGVDNFKSPGA